MPSSRPEDEEDTKDVENLFLIRKVSFPSMRTIAGSMIIAASAIHPYLVEKI
jgi:hypothetical protein